VNSAEANSATASNPCARRRDAAADAAKNDEPIPRNSTRRGGASIGHAAVPPSIERANAASVEGIRSMSSRKLVGSMAQQPSAAGQGNIAPSAPSGA
jgi:hypothetical protein